MPGMCNVSYMYDDNWSFHKCKHTLLSKYIKYFIVSVIVEYCNIELICFFLKVGIVCKVFSFVKLLIHNFYFIEVVK